MKSIIKVIWVVAIIIVILSMIWFLLGTTACFQKQIGLITTVIYVVIWIPALFFVVLSLFALKKGWLPSSIYAKSYFVIIIIAVSIFFTVTFLRNATPYGWIIERVNKDYIQKTVDERYEYRLELVNLFQRNSYARLYVKDVFDEEEIGIYLDIPTQEIYAITGGEGSIYPEPEIPPVWSVLSPTQDSCVYLLVTTKEFDVDNIYIYEIDISSKTSRRLTQGTKGASPFVPYKTIGTGFYRDPKMP